MYTSSSVRSSLVRFGVKYCSSEAFFVGRCVGIAEALFVSYFAMAPRLVSSIVFCVLLIWAAGRSAALPPESASAAISSSARRLLDALSPELRKRIAFSFDDAGRKDWSNLPVALPPELANTDVPPPNDSYPRKGLPLTLMDDQGRLAVHDLLRSSLSSRGYAKVAAILRREMFRNAGRADRPYGTFGSYFVDLFGRPGGAQPWGWQLDGHHLALNFTVANGTTSAVPAFWGASPDLIKTGPEAGFRALGYERAKGFALVQSFDQAQQRKAVVRPVVPEDLFAMPPHDKAPQQYEGLPATAMTADQRMLLWSLIEEFIGNQPDEVARRHRTRIEKDGIGKVHFAWMGPTDDQGKSVYYRVHGPSILIEYDNTRTPAATKRAAESKTLDLDSNHIHTVVRDPSDDYGEDLLREHYRRVKH